MRDCKASRGASDGCLYGADEEAGHQGCVERWRWVDALDGF